MYQEIHTPSATYTFRLYPINTVFKRIAGIYTFLIIPVAEALEARHPEPVEGQQTDIQHPAPRIQQYSLLYIGITNDFYARLATHHKIDAAITLGMTHIGILRKASGRKRKSIEKNLLQNLNPPLNQTWLHDIPS